MAPLVGYVAFTAARAEAVDETGRVHLSLFGPPKRWIPFADSVEHAIDKAMASSRGNPQSATMVTQWCILRVAFAADDFVHAFNAGLIHKPRQGPDWTPQPGWRYYGDLTLGDGHAYEWLQLTIAPVGVDQWAEQALSQYKKQPDSWCKGCRAAPVTAWVASKSHARHLFCATCWHEYFTTLAAGRDSADYEPDPHATAQPSAVPPPGPEHAP